MIDNTDTRWLAAAAALSERARPQSRPNPPVGAIVVRHGIVMGRGWTRPGGRPHAEAVALAQAGERACGATLYVTLEPCAHRSQRGPACADLAARAGLARVVVGMEDPDERTAGAGIARLRDASVEIELANDRSCAASLAGYLSQKHRRRPEITLKLAMSLDGCIATAAGESKWITGAPARAHPHRERARSDAILVGGGTLRADAPSLDVRLPGLEERAPLRIAMTRTAAPPGWLTVAAPQGVFELADVQSLLVEGGAVTAGAFLAADLVDRLMIYRAPVVLGDGKSAVSGLGLDALADAHNRWRLVERRHFAPDTLEIFTRTR